MELKVCSPNVRYTADAIEADYLYQTTDVSVEGNRIKVTVKMNNVVHAVFLSIS